jgi:hypothetical protein
MEIKRLSKLLNLLHIIVQLKIGITAFNSNFQHTTHNFQEVPI